MQSVDDIRNRSQELLHELAGPSAILRDDQADAIVRLVHERRRVLVVQRTGWGKSAVYFLAAKLLREQGGGPTVLISPLLALMRDQLLAASRMGLAAETINSSNVDDWSGIEKRISNDEVDLLAISPERLNNPKFVETVLPNLAARVGLVVIDEAHCISQWGHDFRPDYLRIRDTLARLTPGTPVLATTATATNWVIDDVASQLGAEPLTMRGTLDRASLALSVVCLDSDAERLAWLAEQLPQLPGSGIVYCLTQSAAEQTAAWLVSQGVEAAAYTGTTDTDRREQLEHALRDNKLKVLAATSALGMGFDKPDLAFAINLGAPSSITSYYQMVGRAGRALEHAEGILMPGESDQRVWDWFDQVSFPPRRLAEGVVGFLDMASAPASEAKIEVEVDIKRGRLNSLLKVLDVEGAVRRQPGGWTRTSNDWQYNQERYDRVREARRVDQQHVLEYQALESCRMAFLRASLDDPEMSPQWTCQRCDICTGSLATKPDPIITAAAADFCRQADVELPARKMWPTGVPDHRGKINEQRRALDGRALAQIGTPGWGEIVNDLLNNPEAPIPSDLIKGCATVLKRWGWPEGRPTWITWIPSARRPTLARRIAEELGRVGKLPVQESLSRTRDASPQSEMGNSAHACTNVSGAFAMATDIPTGVALVVDDTWASGWTMTIAVDLLKSNGVSHVYPFVLQKS